MTDALGEIEAPKAVPAPAKPKPAQAVLVKSPGPAPGPEVVGRDISRTTSPPQGQPLTIEQMLQQMHGELTELRRKVDSMPFDPDGRAKAAYRAYSEQLNWKNSQGNRIPDWHDLSEGKKKAWIAAAAAVV